MAASVWLRSSRALVGELEADRPLIVGDRVAGQQAPRH